MSIWNECRALVVVLALLAGLLMATGTLRAKNRSGQAVFVAGWSLVLISSLVIVQNY